MLAVELPPGISLGILRLPWRPLSRSAGCARWLSVPFGLQAASAGRGPTVQLWLMRLPQPHRWHWQPPTRVLVLAILRNERSYLERPPSPGSCVPPSLAPRRSRNCDCPPDSCRSNPVGQESHPVTGHSIFAWNPTKFTLSCFDCFSRADRTLLIWRLY